MPVCSETRASMSCVYKNRCSAWISGSVAGAVPGGGPVHIADLLAVLRLDVIPVPLVIEGAVHVDPAGAGIVAEHAVFIPVRALHAEDGEGPRRRVVRLAAIERGDEAVAVDVRVGIAEGDAVAVCVLRAQVRAGVDDEGLLIAVRVDDRDDIDRVGRRADP